MDKLRWMPDEEAESTIVASEYLPQGVDSEGSSCNGHANMSGDGLCDDALIDGSMEHDQEDQPPLGSDDEEQVFFDILLTLILLNFRKIQRIIEKVVTIL